MATVSILLYAMGCETETGAGEEGNNTTGLSQEQVDGNNVRGGLHPFELIENPEFVPVSDMGNLKDSDMVFLSRALGYVQVFPHKNMRVEVVNDEGNNVWMAVTYCPITRSGISMNRVVENDTMLLTASGYLYKENMMPLDVKTGSIWSQMLLRRYSGRKGSGSWLYQSSLYACLSYHLRDGSRAGRISGANER